MVVVTSKDFRANQSKYIGYAHSGEDVILKSRVGSLKPMLRPSASLKS